jgi:hypothetical protein
MTTKNKKQVETVNENVTALAVIEPEVINNEETLRKEIERRTAMLQQCLSELNRKQELSAHRSTFVSVLDDLESAEDQLLQEEDFNSGVFKLKFGEYHGYKDDDIFTIGNRNIILEFIRFIRGKVTEKIREIEQQLIA